MNQIEPLPILSLYEAEDPRRVPERLDRLDEKVNQLVDRVNDLIIFIQEKSK